VASVTPVKGQCSRNYFYGEDLRLEKWLQRIEAEYGRLIGKISEPRYKLDEPGRFLLRRFMLLQYSRTETAARRRATGTEDMHDAVFSNRKNPEEIDLSIRSIAQDCMKTFGAIMHVVDDLKILPDKERHPAVVRHLGRSGHTDQSLAHSESAK
jgi:hypothetical protein